MSRLQHGFTLIEMMIAAAVVGILASIAVPNFQAPLQKARRSDGITALLQLQMTQEQWRSGHTRYASLAELRAPATSGLRYYTLEVVDATANGYTLVATATGAQASDRGCRVLRVTIAGGQATRSSGPDERGANAEADNRRCWGL
ncbi:MAG TPA: type IV pilin protein [Rhizobacter sp.]